VLSHHELCFGCGRTNLFGLLVELEPQADGSARGRCFIKQDHQGAERGQAHEGVIAAALSEAIALAAGPQARICRLKVEITASAPVGTFLELHAWPDRARASVEGELVATATASIADR
jgi:hypothetical protein